MVEPVPAAYGAVTAYLTVADAAAALDWYAKVLGAEELMRMDFGDGRIGHGEMRLGDRIVMLSGEFPEMGARSPQHYGGSPVGLLLYVPDVDALAARAVEAGASLASPVETQFYGDRMGTMIDPFGHKWFIATHVEDVPPEEMERRAAAWRTEQAAKG
ncbi:VOC family protein [Caenispirillum bisanense]|uniref:PhnB protein n=1 Tax=Caenispirillum bisanense TaxID=414052 RepID=A0A286GYM7_9PROT|nr:VOC family protein [Caenispirillum bisanense]SOE00591.1 PhnB protein [Caenispirillum bisanense]